MTNLIVPRYVLAVNNLDDSVEYYRKVLGFQVVNRYPGWTFISRDNMFLMLGECKDEKPANEIGDHSYFAYVDVHDVKSLFEEFQKNNATFIKQLTDEPWGMREFGISTIDGHRMMFGQVINDQ